MTAGRYDTHGDKPVVAEFYRLLHQAPAWLCSALTHGLILLLALSIPIDLGGIGRQDDVVVGLEKNTGPLDPLFRSDDYLDELLDAPEPLEDDQSIWDENDSLSEEQIEKLAALTDKDRNAATSIVDRPDPGDRSALALRAGGTAGSEKAVNAGLHWLFTHQNRDGTWDPSNYHKNCDANAGCGEGKEELVRLAPGCTGLGLMCFLGAGYTGEQHLYRTTIERTIRYFLRRQKASGAYTKYGERSMYNHAIATLAMGEAYAMTRRSDIRRSVKKAIEFIAASQNRDGGWRYDAQRYPSSDTSVTGWVVMALKSARLGGLDVSQDLFDGAKRWVDHATHKPSGVVGYTAAGNCVGPTYTLRLGNGITKMSPSTTAVGMLCREFMGTPRSDPILRKAASVITKCPPKFGDPAEANLYYYYYAMLALYQYGGQPWKEWNPQVRDALVQTQETQGCARGSWRPSFHWAHRNGSGPGRIYSTTMAVLTLEVYYRYLPIYKSDDAISEIDEALIAYKEALESYRDFRKAARAEAPEPEAISEAAKEAEGRIVEYLTAERKIVDLTDKQASLQTRRQAAANMRLAAIYLDTQRFGQCIEMLDYIEKTFPKFKDSDAIKALRLKALGSESRRLAGTDQKQRANTLARQAVEIRYKELIRNPDQPFRTYLWVANKFHKREDFLRAATMYETLFNRFGDVPEHEQTLAQTRPALAKCYVQTMQWNKALKLLRELEKEHPKSAPLKRDIVRCLRETGRYDDALEICVKLRDGFPRGDKGWWDAKWRIADLLFAKGEYKKVHDMIAGDERIRPSLGGPEFKPRLQKLKQAAEQAMTLNKTGK